MTLVVLAFLGGVLSILSPCILPVVPFVFARGDRPFLATGAPLLAGMALSFAAVASLAAVAGAWAVEANQWGRWIALAVLGLFALTLVSQRAAQALTRPLVRLGARWSSDRRDGVAGSVLLGVATGLLWAPCAGPILGLVLTTAALKGAGIGTSLLLFAYACGAATALAAVLLAGGRVLAALKRRLGLGTWIRRGLGVAVLCGVAAVATGIDTDLLTRIDLVDTAPAEQWLLDHLGPRPSKAADGERSGARAAGTHRFDGAALAPAVFEDSADPLAEVDLASTGGTLPVERRLPGLGGATEWLNSAPLTAESLRGKVVLVEFWTYACINCRHVLPHVKAWAETYREAGLVVVGVHTPELAFEKVTANVRRAVAQLDIGYPVAIDTNATIWGAFGNEFWPANYFVDRRGRIRYHHFGEEDYANQERVIQELLAEGGGANLPGGGPAADSQ